jgi:hypothetical protein
MPLCSGQSINRIEVHPATDEDLTRFVQWSQIMAKARERQMELVNAMDDGSVVTAFEGLHEEYCLSTNDIDKQVTCSS